MNLTGPMILAADVTMVQVTELPAAVRRRLRASAGDHALAHRRNRAAPRIVDGAGAALLGEFVRPARIVDAVLAFSLTRRTDPARVLRASFPLLRDAINAGFLVPAGSRDAREIRPALEPGARVGGFVVQHCIQVLTDAEVYQVRNPEGAAAALKIARPSRPAAALQHEAAVLAHLELEVVPRLLAVGRARGRPYLVTEWRSGESPEVQAERYRRRGGAGGRARLLRLCRRIVAAYRRLHARGIVHGDVHPGNLLVDARGKVTVLDFGWSRCREPATEQPSPARGAGEYLEPECAAAIRARRRPPPATPQGEQYAIAALLYHLVTGGHYLAFSPHEPEMLRQIGEDHPLPFPAHGVPPWPDLDAILHRALAKPPADRFGSLAAFARALRRVRVPGKPQGRAARHRRQEALRDILRHVGLEGLDRWSGPAEPSASVSLGAAGIAYGLYRISCLREDPRLFAAADVWLQRAVRAVARRDAWYAKAAGITPRVVGKISPYHAPPGVYWVQALLSGARGDTGAQQAAVDAFVKASRAPCHNPDLTLGRAGTLLACALLWETVTGGNARQAAAIDSLGRKTLAALLDRLDRWAPPGRCRNFPNLGLAHGWGGVLYAILQWYRSAGMSVPPGIRDRLLQLADCAEPSGRGAVWPWRSRDGREVRSHGSMPGWCNGSAGFVFLWTLAHRLEGDDRYLALAERSALEAWQAPRGPAWDLCCGLAGRAYALLSLYRRTGASAWLDRARRLGDQAAQAARDPAGSGHETHPYSLYRGRVGLATLLADLEEPDHSCFPLLEGEGLEVNRSPT